MNARWLMAMLWHDCAGGAVVSARWRTLFVWLGHLLYRPGSPHASADWLFHVFVVGLPATVTAVFVRGEGIWKSAGYRTRQAILKSLYPATAGFCGREPPWQLTTKVTPAHWPSRGFARGLALLQALTAGGAQINANPLPRRRKPCGAATVPAAGSARGCVVQETLKHDASWQWAAACDGRFEAATASGRIADWERLPVENEIRLVNPLAGLRLGTRSPSPPRSSSCRFPALGLSGWRRGARTLLDGFAARRAALGLYERNSLVREAVAELRQTKLNASATPQTLFRLGMPETEGHWISQFLWMPVPYGAQNQWQQYPGGLSRRRFHDPVGRIPQVANGEWPPGIMNHYADLYYLRSGRDVSGVCALGFLQSGRDQRGGILFATAPA